jgi:threonine dehydratase
MAVKSGGATVDTITFDKLKEAAKNIAETLKETPIVCIEAFDKLFNHDVYFKLENFQETGAFKVRGVINSLHNLKQSNGLPKKIVTYGTGNHGLALAWASRFFAIDEVKIYLPSFTSEIKKELAIKYGATVVITETRSEAERRAQEDSTGLGYLLLPPSDNDDIIAGAATIAYEAFQEHKDLDAIFIPVGGGSLASGTVLARQYMSPTTKVYAGEPMVANDASRSYKTGEIFRFKEAPTTIADGATALGVTPRVFNYVKQLDGIYEISEKEIAYWATLFSRLAKTVCEPTSALAIAAAYRWAKEQHSDLRKKILIIITGGNVSTKTQQELYRDEFLTMSPEELKFDNL